MAMSPGQLTSGISTIVKDNRGRTPASGEPASGEPASGEPASGEPASGRGPASAMGGRSPASNVPASTDVPAPAKISGGAAVQPTSKTKTTPRIGTPQKAHHQASVS